MPRQIARNAAGNSALPPAPARIGVWPPGNLPRLAGFFPWQNSEVSSKTVLLDNHRRFLGFLEKRVGDRAAAEDILQDAFVRNLDKADAGCRRRFLIRSTLP